MCGLLFLDIALRLMRFVILNLKHFRFSIEFSESIDLTLELRVQVNILIADIETVV